MNKKPTTPFGYIGFGKNGHVVPEIVRLSSNKEEQELAVAQALLDHMPVLKNDESISITQLDQTDHDFAICKNASVIAKVQCTEIVYRDFIDLEKTSSAEYVAYEDKLLAVNLALRDAAIKEKIKLKLAKNYAKPKDCELWLLIWSVTGYLGFYEIQTLPTPKCVKSARQFVEESGNGAFDRILVFNMLSQPTIIWPPQIR